MPSTSISAAAGLETQAGEMAALIQAFNWGATAIGAPETWSPALRMMVPLLLANRFPLLLWWGPDYIQIYNDPYRPIPGDKHPKSLGQPARECWPEIWHIIGPLIDTPFHGGPATWSEDLELVINRAGFFEETHFTVAYSAVPDETAPRGIGGVLATVHEITEEIVGQRRVMALRDLSSAVEVKNAAEACAIAAASLANYAKDIPFALLYLTGADGREATLAAAMGIGMAPEIAPPVILLSQAGGNGTWPLEAAQRTGEMQVLEDLGSKFAQVPPGPWADPPDCAVVAPIRANIAHQFYGFFVAGVSSRLRLDAGYKDFLRLATSQIATAIANARAYEEERRRAEALAEIDRAKTAFFSNVSHEFRTPLTLMLGPIEEMLKDPTRLSPGDLAQLTTAHRNSLRLLKLVNSLLDFSRIEAGRSKATYLPLDLAPLTNELCLHFHSAMQAAGLKFVVDCAPLPEPVYADREMWETIVLNLLSNAFKFTFDGAITVRLNGIGDHMVLSVADTGVGIPDAELPRIFERFHRVEGSRGRTFEGTGIGLALIQELVKLHGGTIEVQSSVGEGATFTVRLPFGKAHLPQDRIGGLGDGAFDHAFSAVRPEAFTGEVLTWISATDLAQPTVATERTSGEAAANRPRILLADDNSDMREYIAHILGGQYELVAVSDGRAALEEARRARPDLVLSDIMMPRLDGFGLLQEIRADERLRDLPVVFLSARAGGEARTEGVAAGADDYLTKPFNARELLARVQTHVQMARWRKETELALRQSEGLLSADLYALRRIQQVRMRLTGSAELQARLSEILAAAADIIGTDKGSIQLYDPKSGALRIVAHQGFGERFLRRFFDKGASMVCHEAARKLQRVVWENIADAPELEGTEDLQVLLGDGIQAIQSTPLVSLDGRLLGVLNNHFRMPHRPNERELGYIDLLARMAADFIERWHGERALRESEARFRAAAMGSSDIVFRMNADWTEMRDLTGAEFIAGALEPDRNWIESYIHPDDRPKAREASEEAIRSKSTFEFEHRILRAGGSVSWAISRIVPIFGEAGEIVEWFGTVKDVTERKKAEEKFRETQRLESLGLLAGGIAHDFNNLLTGVLGNASLLAEEFPERSAAARIVDGLTEAAERMARLTSQMLAYSGRGHFVVEAVDVSDQVDRITGLIHASIPKNVNLKLSLAKELPLVDVDVSQLQQVIMNLVINAAESIGEGEGSVEVKTAVERVADEELQNNVAQTSPPPGEYVCLTVKDAGCGMDEETRSRIFDPFFTTKFTGRGLGLSSVIGIVRGHKGLITVESHAGEGAAFRVFFPISATTRARGRATAVTTSGKGVVLVVDDESVVRQMAQSALERLGYSVITAVNGKEGLDLFRANPGAVDVVLLDMTMPVMSGEETLKRIRSVRPDATVLAMSGFDEREAKQRFGDGIAGFVQKPFTAAKLGAKIAAALPARV